LEGWAAGIWIEMSGVAAGNFPGALAQPGWGQPLYRKSRRSARENFRWREKLSLSGFMEQQPVPRGQRNRIMDTR
jgi:hypothetical protein